MLHLNCRKLPGSSPIQAQQKGGEGGPGLGYRVPRRITVTSAVIAATNSRTTTIKKEPGSYSQWRLYPGVLAVKSLQQLRIGRYEALPDDTKLHCTALLAIMTAWKDVYRRGNNQWQLVEGDGETVHRLTILMETDQ